MKDLLATAITPVVLTWNEEPNVERTLKSLSWAERVVVVDSGSTDATESIARSFTNVDWHTRRFHNHCSQWLHGVRHTNITTDFVLALDADMSVPGDFVDELRSSFLLGAYGSGITPFEFRILGIPISGSIYPPQLRLFRPDRVCITQPGHTQEFSAEGPAYRFQTRLIHDDRKPLDRWVSSQLSYSELEARRIGSREFYRFRDKLREFGVMPLIAGALAYLRAGGPFRGAAAVRYAYERATYESLLAIRLMSDRLAKEKEAADTVSEASDPALKRNPHREA